MSISVQENLEELTWQTYKGPLTEKQQKTLEKVHKRNEKVDFDCYTCSCSSQYTKQ